MDFQLSFCRRFLPEISRPTGYIRAENSHFQVDEMLGLELAGEGEHLYLQIRKSGQNTIWVKEQLARQLGIKPLDIGHSGLKDRHAVTTQWLSLYSPAATPDLDKIQIEGVEILQSQRHTQKLRPGTHRANRFRLRVTDISPFPEVDEILEQIRNRGFPNYFGTQRFGRDGNNLEQGWQLLQKRRLRQHNKKAIYLSALRSFLFNQVLSAHIGQTGQGQFDTAFDTAFDSTGPLWGRGRQNVPEGQREFEKNVLQPWQPLCEALEYSGLNQERRDLYQIPQDLTWDWPENNQLWLDFILPPGCFATALLYEILDCHEPATNS